MKRASSLPYFENRVLCSLSSRRRTRGQSAVFFPVNVLSVVSRSGFPGNASKHRLACPPGARSARARPVSKPARSGPSVRPQQHAPHAKHVPGASLEPSLGRGSCRFALTPSAAKKFNPGSVEKFPRVLPPSWNCQRYPVFDQTTRVGSGLVRYWENRKLSGSLGSFFPRELSMVTGPCERCFPD